MCQKDFKIITNSEFKIKCPIFKKYRQITYFLRTAINLEEAGALLIVNTKTANLLKIKTNLKLKCLNS